jgi:hypothetical protein
MARAKAQRQPLTLARLREVLGAYRYSFSSELGLQDGIAQVLALLAIPFDREVPLNAKDRPDFMVDGIAVEVKVDGTTSEVTRQIHRYAQEKSVQAVLLVTSRLRHDNLPSTINRKPVAVLALLGGIQG